MTAMQFTLKTAGVHVSVARDAATFKIENPKVATKVSWPIKFAKDDVL